jgi:hypothetical protein
VAVLQVYGTSENPFDVGDLAIERIFGRQLDALGREWELAAGVNEI